MLNVCIVLIVSLIQVGTLMATELATLRKGMEFGISLGLRVNAGHGINYDNVEGAKQLDQVYEFNIGHSIISRSITHGLQEAVQKMRAGLND